MKREIKFRVKAINGDKWYYGSLIDYGNPAFCDIVRFNDDNEAIHEYVDINTVGQYTGFYDKNGKEIYEGDILRKSTFVDNDLTETYLERDTVGVVRILPSRGTTICNCIAYETDDPYEEKKTIKRFERSDVVGKRSEVIGNIYDNPELLEGGKK